VDGSEFKSRSERFFFFLPERPNRLWGPPSHVYDWCRGSCVGDSPVSSAEVETVEMYLCSSSAPSWLVGDNFFKLLRNNQEHNWFEFECA
jgi:hypothetical protein